MIHPSKKVIVESGPGTMTSRYLWGQKFGPCIYYDSKNLSIRRSNDLGETQFDTEESKILPERSAGHFPSLFF